MSNSNETPFGEYVFKNNLTTFEALSELDVVQIGGEVSRLQTDLDQTRSELAGLARQFDDLTVRFNTIEFRVEDVESEAQRLNGVTTTLNQQVSGLTTIVQEIIVSVRSLAADIESVNAKLGAIDTNILNINGRVTQVEQGMSGFRDDLDALQSRLNTTNSSVSALQSQVGDLSSRLTTLEPRVQKLDTDVTTLNSIVLNNRISIFDGFLRLGMKVVGYGQFGSNHNWCEFTFTSMLSDVVYAGRRYRVTGLREIQVNGNSSPIQSTEAGFFSNDRWPSCRVRTGTWRLEYRQVGSGTIIRADPFHILDYFYE